MKLYPDWHLPENIMKKCNFRISLLSVVFLGACIAALLSAGCGRNSKHMSDMEGFVNGSFRVVINVSIGPTVKKSSESLENYLVHRGKNRASELLYNYIAVNHAGTPRAEEIRKAIPSLLNSAKLHRYECDDLLCLAVIDCDARPVSSLLTDKPQPE